MIDIRHERRKLRASARRLQALMHEIQEGRILGTTKDGYFGVFPDDAEVGDQIVFIAGCAVPFVVRQRNIISGHKDFNVREWSGEYSEKTISAEYQIVGACYMHRLMDGEGLIREWTLPDKEIQDLVIV
jgi:hypothetical protein